MKYAQFFQLSSGSSNEIPPRQVPRYPIEACGSDSVLILDGRHSLLRMHEVARERAKRYGFIGFEIREAQKLNGPHTVLKGYFEV